MKITIIGAGNVAWHLAKAFINESVELNEVYARNLEKAEAIASLNTKIKALNSLNFSESKSDVFIICVSDDSISVLADQLIIPHGRIVVHTSGAKSMEELKVLEEKYSAQIGVFYPLQTFSKNVNLDFRKVPLLIETTNSDTLEVLFGLGRKISESVQEAKSADRLAYHVGAVLACNFVNHLWTLSKDMLERQQLNFNLLKPLILETLNKMLGAENPANVQTGPAARGDLKTLEKHSDFLENDPKLLEIYELMSKSILYWHRLDN